MKRTSVLALAAAAALAVPSAAQAADTRVFVTSTDNEFVVVDFDAGTTTVAGQANGSQFQGLAVRGSGNQVRVLVSSSSQGGQLLIFAPDSGETSGAVVAQGFAGGLGGITVDGTGNVFALSEGGGATGVWAILRKPSCDPLAMQATPGCLPGGYAEPIALPASLPGAQRLADVKVVPYTGGGLVAGDLLIAAARPGRLYCVPNPLLEDHSLDPDHHASANPGPEHCEAGVFSDALAGFEPTGLAFAPDGDILVSVWKGDVLRLDYPGFEVTSFTGNGTPGNATAISVSLDGEDVNAFVATHNGGAVTRYGLDGTELGTVSAGFQAPNGIGSLVATLSAATPAGANQTIRATADEITFDIVTGSGITTLEGFVFDDPRDGVHDTDESTPLASALDVDALLDLGLPGGLEIPAHFRPRNADDGSGRKIIVLLRGETTAAFAGTINHHIFEHFGADGDCSATESYLQPRLLWAPDTGGVMEDITSDCGSDVGRAWRFSWFALAYDTRSLGEALIHKVDTLDTVASCLGRSGRVEQRAIASARRNAQRGRYCKAQSDLTEVFEALDATAGTCEAEVEARARSAAYTASLACAATP